MTILKNTDLRELQETLASDNLQDEQLQFVADRLSELSHAARESSEELLSQGSSVLAQLAELAVAARSEGDGQQELSGELVGFVSQHVGSLLGVLEGDQENADPEHAVAEFIRQAQSRWSEYLVCLDQETDRREDGWLEAPPLESHSMDDAPDEVDLESPAGDVGEQIEMLLSALHHSEDQEVEVAVVGEGPNTQPASDNGFENASNILRNIFEDDEMREAFLDDATRCLDAMEKCSLAVETCPTDADSIQQFCRELHTLKGASASAGLAELADFIHQIESSLTAAGKQPSEGAAESMLEAVDKVREVVAEITSTDQSSSGDADPTPGTNPSSTTSARGDRPSVVLSGHAGADESLIRIRASKLDRLMDMLAELVVLRNRRESHIAEFSEFNEELSRCAARLNFCHENLHVHDATDPTAIPSSDWVNGSNTIQEIAKDISVVSNSIRELQKPVGKDNLAISQFIRDFRQELMQLRRVPIAGLFSRLQRAARDAAKKEGKAVRLVCLGEKSGLEQELQEKLYEPLMHIIRNAVSHGIEHPDRRKQSGKNPTGTLTLEAHSNSQLLAVQISDDGGGLDYDAIRRRTIEKGLASPNTILSDEELSRMIFHPGFSTREQATEISGRGVGMDVVAAAVEQMRGRIEIDSRPDQGTTMRLVLPLRSAIEHVMVIRCSGQLFGIPMQAVSAAARSRRHRASDTTMPLSAMLSLPLQTNTAEREVLMLRAESSISDSDQADRKAIAETEKLGLEVDEIIGPEEVVVRNLPGPLSGHPLFCGLTLSGAGETVLLLDGNKLVEYFTEFHSVCQPSVETEETVHQQVKRVLVVDDSLSARKMLVKRLSQLGFGCTEAGDGIQALEILRRDKFDLVFTDLDMPRLGGLEMLFDMQQHGRTKTPVVVVSARSEDEFRHQAMDYGAYGYLTKPVDFQRLQRLLDELELNQKENNNPENGEKEDE